MHIDPARLRFFREVARTGSYSEAAKRLHVTTSAVSHAVRKLREETGCALIEKRGRRLELTPDGLYLYGVSQRVYDELEEAGRRLCSGERERSWHIVLGSTVEFGTTVLLPRLRPLLESHPGLHIDFHFSNDLAGPLLHDDIDLAVDCRDYSHPAVDRRRMFREKYTVVASPGLLEKHTLAGPPDLGAVPVLSLDGEGTWWNRLLNALPAGERPLLGEVVVIDNVRGMINAAVAGYGAGLLPKYSVIEELSAGSLTVLFPGLELLEDYFSIYQKLSRSEREANRIVAGFLLGLDISEFGDAIGPGE